MGTRPNVGRPGLVLTASNGATDGRNLIDTLVPGIKYDELSREAFAISPTAGALGTAGGALATTAGCVPAGIPPLETVSIFGGKTGGVPATTAGGVVSGFAPLATVFSSILRGKSRGSSAVSSVSKSSGRTTPSAASASPPGGTALSTTQVVTFAVERLRGEATTKGDGGNNGSRAVTVTVTAVGSITIAADTGARTGVNCDATPAILGGGVIKTASAATLGLSEGGALLARPLERRADTIRADARTGVAKK
jgi:hypothetical protein